MIYPRASLNAGEMQNETSNNEASNMKYDANTPAPSPRSSSIFSIPRPLKRLFDSFPLVTLPPNALPPRSPAHFQDSESLLFLWSTDPDAQVGAASFNPTCLKWQAYLISRGFNFRIVPSNNHASASESLPFLLTSPKSPIPSDGRNPVMPADVVKWANVSDEPSLDENHEAYASLVNGPIRRAWLYHMYLTKNFNKFVVPLYINAQSSSSFVQFSSAWDLQEAARKELLKHRPVIDVDGLYEDAEAAFEALEFFMTRNSDSPRSRPITTLDAGLFSYLFLLLELHPLGWVDDRLPGVLRRFDRLVEYKSAVNTAHFGGLTPPRLYIDTNKLYG